MKTNLVKNIVDAVSEYSESMGRKLDSNQTAFISQQLTQILPKTLEVLYPELKGRSFVPLNGSMSAGVEFFKTVVYDQKGAAAIIADGITELPALTIIADEIIQKVLQVGGFYGWTMGELEAAAFAQVPLDALKAKTARRAIETAIDSIVATGGTLKDPSSVTKTTGLLNNANVSSFVFPHAPWATASPAEILSDLNLWSVSVNTQSKTVFSADTMILSPYWFNYLSTTPYSDVVPDSILSVFAKNSPSITAVDQWYKAEDFIADGYDIGVVYQKSDEVLSFGNPVAYQELPPQFIDLNVKIPVRATATGVVVFQPLGISYATMEKP